MQILSNIGCFDFSKSVVRPKYRTNKRQKLRFGLVARMFSVSQLRLKSVQITKLPNVGDLTIHVCLGRSHFNRKILKYHMV